MSQTTQSFCQSCGMPLSPAVLGTERDGTPSRHYCKHCYQSGAFTASLSMDEMIRFCVGPMVQANPELTPDQAREQMQRFFPSLLRWRNESGQA